MASTSVEQSICLPYDEAITNLPVYMLGNSDDEKHELAMFFKKVDDLHEPGDNLSAKSILYYVHQLFVNEVGEEESQRNRSEGFDGLFNITGKIATEIACGVMNGVDLHNITIEVLNILQSFSWETKVALAVTTYTLTFGDFGLNMCAKSKVSINEIPLFLERLIDVTSCIVELEKLPTIYMTSKKVAVKVARTHIIGATYWIIRAIVATSASHIMSTSSRTANEVGTTITSTLWVEKLEVIRDHLMSTLQTLEELLEEDVDNESYEKIKEIVYEKDHSDNMKVLNAIFSTNDDDNAPQLYNGLTKKMAYVNELRGKNVLLFISSVDIVQHERDTIIDIYNDSKKKFEFEMVWIPVVEKSLQFSNESNTMFEKRRNPMPWYYVQHLSMVKNAIKKLFEDDWKFKSDPIIVALDPLGNVVNPNAINMMLMWHSNAVPFTSTREKTLWEQETWRLELLINGGVDQQIMDWVYNEYYIFMCGDVNSRWMKTFFCWANKVGDAMQVPIAVLYVRSNGVRSNSVRQIDFLKTKKENVTSANVLTHYLSDHALWYFWRRRNMMIPSMIQHGKFDGVILQEMLRLDNHIKSYEGWTIFAKGSKILVNGHGEIVRSALTDFNIELEEGFKSHYKKLYLERFPTQRLELPTTTIKFPENMDMACPDCYGQMQNYTTLFCSHPSMKLRMSPRKPAIRYTSPVIDHFGSARGGYLLHSSDWV